jgi:hypothetical protein
MTSFGTLPEQVWLRLLKDQMVRPGRRTKKEANHMSFDEERAATLLNAAVVNSKDVQMSWQRQFPVWTPKIVNSFSPEVYCCQYNPMLRDEPWRKELSRNY